MSRARFLRLCCLALIGAGLLGYWYSFNAPPMPDSWIFPASVVGGIIGIIHLRPRRRQQ